MLSSPITITSNTVDLNVHRVLSKDLSSTYRNADGTFELKISHQKSGSRTRRMARIDQTLIAADPLTAVNVSQKAGVYLVIDEPEFGFDNAAVENLVLALQTWLTSANVLAMLADRH